MKKEQGLEMFGFMKDGLPIRFVGPGHSRRACTSYMMYDSGLV